jgi:hypothetical protein
MSNLYEIIQDLRDNLAQTEVDHARLGDSYDVGDVGNSIGIILGKLNQEELTDFFRGVEHGISLTNGSHDDAKKPHTFIKLKIENEEDILWRIKRTEEVKEMLRNENL